MRISTSQIFDSGALAIQRNQSELFKTWNQLSTGKRILTPADDPVGSAQVLVVTQSKEVNSRYVENQGIAEDRLNLLETKLSEASDTIQGLLERAVQAGNTGTLSDAERKSIAADMRQKLVQLMSNANSTDGSGQYIFSGYQTNVKPFTAATDPADTTALPTATPPQNFANPYVTYNGDQGKQTLQVDSSNVMAIAETGNDVFIRIIDKDGNLTGESAFDTIKNMIDLLEKPINTSTTFRTDFDNSLRNMQAILDNTSRIRSSVGSRLSELQSLGTSGSSLDLQYTETLSNLQDVDYASALTTLSKQQLNLETAQKSFVKISALSLFDYL